jgi:hypothetical protein
MGIEEQRCKCQIAETVSEKKVFSSLMEKCFFLTYFLIGDPESKWRAAANATVIGELRNNDLRICRLVHDDVLSPHHHPNPARLREVLSQLLASNQQRRCISRKRITDPRIWRI